MSKNILVTGGSGFIGYNLIKRLSEDGHKISTISRQKHDLSHLKKLNKNVRIYVGNITDSRVVKDAVKGIDIIYHLAGIQPTTYSTSKEMIQTAQNGTKNVLDAGRDKVGAVVVASSSITSGFSKDKEELDEKSSVNSKFADLPYIKSKLIVEDLCQRAEMANVIIANLVKVYGSGDYYGNNTNLRRYMDRKYVFVHPGIGSYVSVDDCVNGLLTLAEKGVSGEKYIVGSENHSFVDIYDYFKKYSGSQAVLIRIPLIFSILLPIYRLLQSGKSYEMAVYGFNNKPTNSEKLRSLGWNPKKSVEDAVKESVEFYEKNNLIHVPSRYKTIFAEAPNLDGFLKV